MKFIDNLSSDKRFNLALAGIIIAGAVFRFRDLGSESLTADEASALLRLKFSSFSAMIEGGVRPDGHPAFAQVLLWFWTKWFGLSEFAVRFPFALMGTASIWLAASVAKKLFNDTVCLCVAAGMAFLEFPMMYSQLARPYAPGLFFTLLAAFFFLKFLEQKKVSWKYVFGYGFAIAMASYSHYFAALEIALLSFIGLFIIKRPNFIPFLLSCVFAKLLFLPYLGIFFHQLKTGGVGGPGGWLGKPNVGFIWNHLRFAFDGSQGILLGVLLLWAISFIIFRKNSSKKQIVLFKLWLLPLVIGYVYSVYRNPVLQNSVLLFGFPFLLMLLFSWLPSLEWTAKLFREKKLIPVIPAVLSLGLVYYMGTYKPYHLTDHFGRLKELVSETLDWQRQFGADKTDVAFNVDADYFVEYYYDRLGARPKRVVSTINNGDKELLLYRKFAAEPTADYFIYAWSTKYSPPEIPEIIREYFPYLVKRELWFNSGFYVFSKSDPGLNYIPESGDILWIDRYEIFLVNTSENPSTQGTGQWSAPCKIIGDSSMHVIDDGKSSSDTLFLKYFYTPSGQSHIQIDSSCTYGPMLKVKLGDVLRNPDNVLVFDADVKLMTKESNAVLVIEIHRGDSLLYWNGRETTTQTDAENINDYQHVYFGLGLQEDLLLSDEVRFYIFSKNGKPMQVRSLTARAMRGQEGIYGARADYK